MFLSSFSVFCQIEDKRFSLSKYILITNGDSLVYYDRDSLENIWDLSKIVYTFNSNNSYNGTAINNSNKTGSWKILSNKLIIDSDTSEIVGLDSYKIIVKNRLIFKEDNINYVGELITELTNYVYSVNSGNWNDVNNWSCNCIPQEGDNVLIKGGTKITLTATMGIQKCKNLTVEKGAVFENSGIFFLAKP